MPIQDPILSQLIFEMDDALPEMLRHDAGRDEAVGRFLSRFGHFAMRLHRAPAVAQTEQAQQFLKRAEGPLLHSMPGIEAYASGLAEMLGEPWEVEAEQSRFLIDHWSRACTERSALQFVLDLYPSLSASGSSARLLEILEEADAHLRRKMGAGEAERHAQAMPDGVPSSHWWWRRESDEAPTE